jgi:hypothetical protein
MKWPPYLLKLRFRGEHNSFSIWLPLFLIGPIVFIFVLAVFLIMLPFALLAVLFTWRIDWLHPVLYFIPAIYQLICHLPGLTIDVEGDDGYVYISFI